MVLGGIKSWVEIGVVDIIWIRKVLCVDSFAVHFFFFGVVWIWWNLG
jgi:hypothetical protein